MRKPNLVAIILLLSLPAFSQNKIISGKVSAADKTPLAGVTIQVKNTNIFTSSAENGSFSINAPTGEKTVLVFTSVGFERQEVEVGINTTLDIVLKDASKELEDVVVVGYGSQRKTDLTGSVAGIRGDKLKELPVVSVEQAMQGRLAGVQVSGQPGAGISVRIRGVSSIAGGNEPLYVIDGLPQFNDDVRGANGLATINPSDIESIEVLKDASATAIYGSRGANGVVMITTKSGKAGQARVTFESSIGFQQVRRKLELMNSEEYVDFAKRYYTSSGLSFPADLASFTPGGGLFCEWQ